MPGRSGPLRGEIMSNDITSLRNRLRGRLIQRGDEGYETARNVYNGMIDRRPDAIAQCRDAADVIASVNYARENDLLLAVRGGGHSGPGLGTCDGGLVIDLSPMKGIRVDPRERTVRVEGGCTWGEVDHATHAFGLAVPSGVISTTGVGGLTLGGGHGYLTRKYGLTIDNLLSADLVLADGSFVSTGPGDLPDLFWAIRGGGGNFGVITSFLFRAHPVKTIYGGPMLWPIERGAEAMRLFDGFLRQAPDDIYGFFALLTVPPVPAFPESLHTRKMAGVVWGCLGEGASEALEPIRRSLPPEFEHTGTMPFPALQSAFDALYKPGLQSYWRGDFVSELPDEAIRAHIEFGSRMPTQLSGMHLYPISGAAHRVAGDATAFSYRDADYSQIIIGVDPDPANAELVTRWTKEYFDAVHPYSMGGAYVNFLMGEAEDRVRKAYRGNYERLAEIKRKYDPGNLFRVNQNIRPAAARTA